jgi:hypothetical protein
MIQKQAYKFQYHNQGHIRYCTLEETEFKVNATRPINPKKVVYPTGDAAAREACRQQKETALLACKLEVSIVLKWVGFVS